MANKKDIVREKTLQMRVNDEEYAAIEEKANEIGLSMSNYMRMVCLHCRIDIAFNPKLTKKE